MLLWSLFILLNFKRCILGLLIDQLTDKKIYDKRLRPFSGRKLILYITKCSSCWSNYLLSNACLCNTVVIYSWCYFLMLLSLFFCWTFMLDCSWNVSIIARIKSVPSARTKNNSNYFSSHKTVLYAGYFWCCNRRYSHSIKHAIVKFVEEITHVLHKDMLILPANYSIKNKFQRRSQEQ